MSSQLTPTPVVAALTAAAPSANPFLASALAGPSADVPEVLTFRGYYPATLDAVEVRDALLLSDVGTLAKQFSSWSIVEVESVDVHFTLPSSFSATLLVGIVPEFHIVKAKFQANSTFSIPWDELITYPSFDILEWRSNVTMPQSTDVSVASPSKWPIGMTSRSLTNALPGFSLPALEIAIRSTSSTKLSGTIGILVTITARCRGRGHLGLPL